MTPTMQEELAQLSTEALARAALETNRSVEVREAAELLEVLVDGAVMCAAWSASDPAALLRGHLLARIENIRHWPDVEEARKMLLGLDG